MQSGCSPLRATHHGCAGLGSSSFAWAGSAMRPRMERPENADTMDGRAAERAADRTQDMTSSPIDAGFEDDASLRAKMGAEVAATVACNGPPRSDARAALLRRGKSRRGRCAGVVCGFVLFQF